MPLIAPTKNILHGCYRSCWQITESEEELLQIWGEPCSDYFQQITLENKRKEWLASRILVKRLALEIDGKFEGIVKDENKKPYLINSKSNISLSHTNGYAAAILHPSRPAGIDIEIRSDKVRRIAKKFMNDTEWASTQEKTDEILAYWCAKEAMYKLNGKKGIIFKKQLLVEKALHEIHFHGTIVNKQAETNHIKLTQEYIDNCLLVSALQE